ncbi:foldase protein PrsA precursor [Lachnospiraceae bacterium KM106-2]|nr:foldase protein PrsA precursor [Lachnospiraceae bacterium KM106-2]
MNQFRRIRKMICISGVSCLVALSAAGCSKNNTNSESQAKAEDDKSTGSVSFDDQMMKVGDKSVSYREVMIYMLQLKNNYESGIGSEIWNFQVDKNNTFSDVAKDEIVSQITELKVIAQQAEKLNIKLNKDEIDEINGNVVNYLKNVTKEDQKKYGITEDVVYQVLSDNYLAEKVFSISTNEVDTNISDDEAKQVKLQQLYVITNGQDKNGTTISMNEKDKKAALKRAKDLLKKAKKTDDFLSFAKSNSDIAEIELELGKGDNKEIESQAFALKKGKLSDVIETSQGYVILYCVNPFDEDATASKKEEIIASRQNEVFRAKYKNWSKEYKVDVNSVKWNKIQF